MDKNRDISRYINTVKDNQNFFKNYYYHSLIDLNLIKLDSILKNGILCKNLIESKGLPQLYTHLGEDYDSKNGNSFVSLTKYSSKTTFNELFESFPLHTLTCLSLLVDKDILEGDTIGCHPCVNTASLKMKTADMFEKVVKALDHEPQIIELPRYEM